MQRDRRVASLLATTNRIRTRSMKRALAVRRWWIAGATVALVAVRIVIAAALGLLGTDAADLGVGVTAALTIVDVLCLSLAVAAIFAFVQYGRIFRTRVPTE